MALPRFLFTSLGPQLKNLIQGPSTLRLLIIGTAQDGPTDGPRQVTIASEFERLFGPGNYRDGYLDPNSGTESGKDSGASLPFYLANAINAGCADIWVQRVPGTTAAATGFSNSLDFRAIYSGRIYNTVSVTLSKTATTLTWVQAQPSMKGGSFTTTFSSAFSIGDVFDLVNNDKRNTSLWVERNTFSSVLANACTTLVSGTATLAGGTNGCRAVGEDYATSVTNYATKLVATDTGTFDVIENNRFGFDVAVLTGIWADDQVNDSGSVTQYSILTDYVYWLDRMSTSVNPCFGVAAVRPPDLRSQSDIISYINNSLLATSYGYRDQNTRWLNMGAFLYNGWSRTDPQAGAVDLGGRLVLVAGPQVVYLHPDKGRYPDQAHASLAAFLTRVAPERAPLNKSIPGILSFGTPFPAKYCDLLTLGVGYTANSTSSISGKGGYLTFAKSQLNFQGPLEIFDDPTCAARDQYTRQNQLQRLINVVQSQIMKELYGFLGEPTDAATLAAMETKVQNVLEGFVRSGGLAGGRGQGYDFTLTIDGADRLLGSVRVWIELSPATAIRRFYITAEVKKTS